MADAPRPLTKLELDTVSRAMNGARLLLEQALPVLTQATATYDKAMRGSLTDADLAAVAAWSGLTKAELDAGMDALIAVREALKLDEPELTHLAVRA
jgi:hypothetical protein